MRTAYGIVSIGSLSVYIYTSAYNMYETKKSSLFKNLCIHTMCTRVHTYTVNASEFRVIFNMQTVCRPL